MKRYGQRGSPKAISHEGEGGQHAEKSPWIFVGLLIVCCAIPVLAGLGIVTILIGFVDRFWALMFSGVLLIVGAFVLTRWPLFVALFRRR